MTTTLPPSIPPRVLEHAEPAARGPLSRASSWRPPEQTIRGVLAGAEAAIGSWLVIVIVTIAGYIATAAAPELGSAGWVDAARAGSAIWLLGHGGALLVGGATVSLIPLGVTLLAFIIATASIRRARLSGWWPLAAVVLTYAAFAGGFAVLADVNGAWRGIIGAIGVAALACAAAMRGRMPTGVAGLIARIPESVRAGLGAGVRAVVLLLALGLATAIVAVILGFSRVMDLHAALVPDGVSSVIIVVAQILLVPTLVLWGVAYLAGPGFAVGAGTTFSPNGIDAGPLPVVPLLGALPEPASLAGSLGIVIVLGVLVGAAAGWWMHRRHRFDLIGSAISVVVCAAFSAAVIGALVAASSGSVGPGRMAELGPDTVAVALAVGWQVLLGAALMVGLRHPATIAGLRRVVLWLQGWWAQVRGVTPGPG